MIRLLLALALFATPTVAAAETRLPDWGITPGQVEETSEGLTRGAYESEHTTIPVLVNLLEGVLKFGDERFRVDYFFNKNSKRLALIELNPRHGLRCEDRPAFYQELFGTGEPTRRTFVAQDRSVQVDDIVWTLDEKHILFSRKLSVEGFGHFGCQLTLISPAGLSRLQALPTANP